MWIVSVLGGVIELLVLLIVRLHDWLLTMYKIRNLSTIPLIWYLMASTLCWVLNVGHDSTWMTDCRRTMSESSCMLQQRSPIIFNHLRGSEEQSELVTTETERDIVPEPNISSMSAKESLLSLRVKQEQAIIPDQAAPSKCKKWTDLHHDCWRRDRSQAWHIWFVILQLLWVLY